MRSLSFVISAEFWGKKFILLSMRSMEFHASIHISNTSDPSNLQVLGRLRIVSDLPMGRCNLTH